MHFKFAIFDLLRYICIPIPFEIRLICHIFTFFDHTMKHHILSLAFFVGLLCSALQICADQPFRDHRYDSWKVLSMPQGAIVFAGNSITDMHLWSEAFGNDPRVVNRGNSGGYSAELLDNVESWLRFKPAKVFIKIGTNDLGTDMNEQSIARDIRRTVSLIRRESPATEIYLQSIIPAFDQKYKTLQTIMATNVLIKQIADETDHTTYIDLYSKMGGVRNGLPFSLDKLHLTAYGYKVWLETIQPYVGLTPVYPANTETVQQTAGLGGSHGMRATYFSMLPVTSRDVLFFGDEMVKNGEWNELLSNPNVKNRGSWWGYGGNIATVSQYVDATFANKKKGVMRQRPAKILLYTGTEDLNGNTDLATVKSQYKALVDKLRKQAGGSPLALVSLMPTQRANSRIVEFNLWLKELAEQQKNVSYIDIYTLLATPEGTASTDYFKGNYLYGLGYIKVARELAKFIGDCSVISDEEAKRLIAEFDELTSRDKKMILTEEIASEPQFEVFPTRTNEDIPYRIPAIATAHDGTLVAVADYRFTRADIGGGRLDLHIRRSHDNGKTWDEILRPAVMTGDGNTAVGHQEAGFGDPCLVGDRESARMLLTSCSGTPGFFGGNRTHHQGWAHWWSDDNGATWSQPIYQDEAFIYSKFDKSQYGPIRGWFVGSGKICQSRRTKVGQYYRLYCVGSSCRQGSNETANWALYSDDFGRTWEFLGGCDVSPVPGGDEPKAEELPDGNILLSSRTSGGRNFNIFTFTNSDRAEGSWGKVAFSGQSNGGVVAQANACNGEIMLVPVIRNRDGREMFLLLQSVPFGGGRTNVGIYYKELANVSDFRSPEAVAKNWTGRHQSSTKGSAYSTMCWQKDNTVAFLYEEDTHGTNGGGYTIVYKNYTIEQITDGAYSYKAGINEDAFSSSRTK